MQQLMLLKVSCKVYVYNIILLNWEEATSYSLISELLPSTKKSALSHQYYNYQDSFKKNQKKTPKNPKATKKRQTGWKKIFFI